VENAMHCVALMLHLGFDSEKIRQRLAKLESVEMRLEVKEGIHGCMLINDSYNSDLNSLGIALDFLNQQAAAKNLPRTLILSDILESGKQLDDLYQAVAQLVKSKNIQRFVGIGPEIVKHADKFEVAQQNFFEFTEDFLKSPLIHELQREIILLKGSRKFHFEKISEKLELVAYETTLEVNLNALINNFNYFRSKLRPENKVMSMVKAFAYGSGSVEVARTLQLHHCDYLAVAVATKEPNCAGRNSHFDSGDESGKR
jgi:alanine racemase